VALLPDYIERRIRRPAPSDSMVIPGSTPVLSFGDARSAAVATLGLNPSRVEFLDENGDELVGKFRRLSTHSSLGTSDLLSAPRKTLARVLDDCNTYFQRNPYRRWFDQLTPVLAVCQASYYDGTACHLDLVQWATNPTWGKLRPVSARRAMLSDDAQFLAEQLRNENLRLLIVNGMTAIRQLNHRIVDDLEEVAPIVGCARLDTRLFVGSAFGHVRVVGWSTNIQSSFGVTRELRIELAKRVGALAS
jgi:hypothetical protein